MNTNTLALNFLRAMQVTVQNYILPDSKISDREFASIMIGHLDGPQQRELQAALEAVQVEPVAWVEVIDRNEGPYNFHGMQLLDSGKHNLYATPQQAARTDCQHLRGKPDWNSWHCLDCGATKHDGSDIWTAPQQAAPGWKLVPVEPTTGKNYEAGLWSRRNLEAYLEDQETPKEGQS